MLYLPKKIHVWFVPRADRALHQLLIDADQLDGTTLVNVPRGRDGTAELPRIDVLEPVLLGSSSGQLRRPKEWAASTIRFRMASTGGGALPAHRLRETTRVHEVPAAELGDMAEVLRRAGNEQRVVSVPVPPWVAYVR
ncbi:hypothetical protein C6N75_15180 [Streptomyces solincola]|uniref:Uncharacterized protein n=1 Tax=Streptomyces solincola TaxID=2100817 RepID=A0A2S9PVD9_9ACTN|nr:hypothetical protein [Streptomyces solincola]PRH78375.1 hypothetical protein C6N75_15180 [Streptomyces solincola]